MDEPQKAGIDQLERSGYLPQLRRLAQRMCAPFWWSTAGTDRKHFILHNGTVCFLNTGSRLIAISADHVYAAYLADKARYPDLGCQFGGATFTPEEYLIDRDTALDLATFDFPELLIAPAGAIAHYPVTWPTPLVQKREVVLLGGYPGNLREEKVTIAEIPFQTFALPVTDVLPDHMILHLDLPNVHWPFHEEQAINDRFYGASGGPVFRCIEAAPIDRLELVGFIFEYSESFDIVRATHASKVASDGRIVRSDDAAIRF